MLCKMEIFVILDLIYKNKEDFFKDYSMVEEEIKEYSKYENTMMRKVN